MTLEKSVMGVYFLYLHGIFMWVVNLFVIQIFSGKS